MNESERLWVHRYPGEPPPMVALHGFTQTGAMFGELAEILGQEINTPDLPGHGRSAGHPASFDEAVAGVTEVLTALGPPVPLIGYSQGGRVALALALERPELVSHLVLISASPGIKDSIGRSERRRVDTARAAELQREGLAPFVDRWLNGPMFEGLARRSATWRASDRAGRLENTAGGLAAALIGMGQGTQPYLGERLSELVMPVLVMAGELDQRYMSLAGDMVRSLPNASLGIVAGAGHAVIGEQPQVVAGQVAGFLGGSQ